MVCVFSLPSDSGVLFWSREFREIVSFPMALLSINICKFSCKYLTFKGKISNLYVISTDTSKEKTLFKDLQLRDKRESIELPYLMPYVS